MKAALVIALIVIGAAWLSIHILSNAVERVIRESQCPTVQLSPGGTSHPFPGRQIVGRVLL
jgi:hypothetical protein